MNEKYYFIAVTVGLALCGCSEKTTPLPAPPPVPKLQTPTPVAVTPAPVAVSAPPASGGAPTNAVNTALTPTDALAGFRTDVDGKTISDVAILQQAVDGYNAARVRLDEPDSKPGPPLTDLNQLVTLHRLPKLPTAPNGQKFVLDQKTQKVQLANQ